MRFPLFHPRLVLLAIAALALPQVSLFAKPLPPAGEVMNRVVERAQRAPGDHPQALYRFQRNTVTEEFNSKGQLRDTQERREDMIFRSGVFYRKRLHEQGRTLLDDQLGSDTIEEAAAYESIDGINWEEFGRSSRGEYLQFLTEDLMARYDFSVLGRTNMNGRATLEIWFQPKTRRAPARKIIERVFNEIAGTFWVDEEEDEVARAYFQLQSPVTLLGGLVGVVRSGAFTIQRVRVDEGVWFNLETRGGFAGRQLFDSKSIRIRSVSEGFRKLTEPDQAKAIPRESGE